MNNVFAIAAVAAASSVALGQVELTTNGNFETGDTSGWQDFPTGDSSFGVTGDSFAGAFAGDLSNVATGSAAVIKQANLAAGGLLEAGQTVNISFWAKGEGAAGGVSFAEFFSELDGGGTSSAEILGGAPLALTSEYQFFSFTTVTGADVSGGVTLQFTATTGANIGSTQQLFIDDVSVTVDRLVPSPGAIAALGLGGLVATRRRRA
ncbi:MAG: carbohydrate binding domain-containing protein [Planctomycetota bacterium]